MASCALMMIVAVATAACGGGTASKSHGSPPRGSVSGVAYGSLPPVGTPTKGGTISFGQLAGQTPSYIFPIVPGSDATSYTFNLIQNLFAPLYSSPTGASPTIDDALSLAHRPELSDHGRTVTIKLKRGYRWSDGAPVDAADVAFEIDLLKAAIQESPSNWSQYTPGQFPTTVTRVATPSKYTLVISLKRAYNPSYLVNQALVLYPLPSTAWNIARPGGPHLDSTNPANAKRIYDFLAAQGKRTTTFGTNPLWKVVDGPFQLRTFDPDDGSYVLAPNRHYGGAHKARAAIAVRTYESAGAQLQALRAGSLDVSQLDFSQLRAGPRLRSHGYSVFGGPSFGWVGATINFEDRTGHFAQIIKERYVREALAHLIDQPAYVRYIFKGAASVNYGPVPSVPANPYAPANNRTEAGPYPFSPSQAASLLSEHGWNVRRNGQTTCRRAGSGPGECGAGIPAGTPLQFNWVDLPRSQSPTSIPEGEAFAAEAKSAAGIDVELETKPFNFQLANYNDADRSGARNRDAWAIANNGGFFYDFYPSSSGVFNSGGVFNAGGFRDPRADRLIGDSVHGSDPGAVTREGAYLTQSLPVLFLPQPANLYAVSKRVGGAADGFGALTLQSLQPQYWYLTK
ncbi:MAG TPA: ABC transporter substrate-binding protein [Solirubrobacteraceae bacterium]|nr:ABC transporter substrate-binding protein [Solirubrobacteraceae bacterium]